MATWTIEAVFQNGCFRPLVPVRLPENTCVTLVIQGEQPQGQQPAPFGQMDESEWIWTAWAGSLGTDVDLAPAQADEG